MTNLLTLIYIFCAHPQIYPKFMNEGATRGLAVNKCYKAMVDCYSYSSDVVYCGEKVWELK